MLSDLVVLSTFCLELLKLSISRFVADAGYSSELDIASLALVLESRTIDIYENLCGRY